MADDAPAAAAPAPAGSGRQAASSHEDPWLDLPQPGEAPTDLQDRHLENLRSATAFCRERLLAAIAAEQELGGWEGGVGRWDTPKLDTFTFL
eukprot:1886145-Alexandrium_andersonii.AAC.1